MPGKLYLSKSSFSKFLKKLILAEGAGRVKIFPSGSIKGSLTFEKFKVIFKVLCSFRVEEPQGSVAKDIFDLLKIVSFFHNFKGVEFGLSSSILVYVNLYSFNNYDFGWLLGFSFGLIFNEEHYKILIN